MSDEFDDIVNSPGMKKWLKDKTATELTVGDLYELLHILSSVQIEMHRFLKEVMSAVIKNNQAGEVVRDMPGMNQKQIASLMNVLDASLAFLEEDTDYGSEN